MRKLSIAILVVGLALLVVLTGCGGGGGGGGSSKGGGNTGDTIVTGRVIDDRQTGAQPVANVVVGVAGQEARTNAKGEFSIDLGSNVRILDKYPTITDAVFTVSTALLDATKYPPLPVTYLNESYPQTAGLDPARIPLPLEAIYADPGTTVNLGDVTIKYSDPDNPPPWPY